MNPKTKKSFEKILIFSKRTQKRLKNITLEVFLRDEYLQDATMYCLGQIGEIASKVSYAINFNNRKTFKIKI